MQSFSSSLNKFSNIDNNKDPKLQNQVFSDTKSMKHGLKDSIEDTDTNKDFKSMKSVKSPTPVNKIQSMQSKKTLKTAKSMKSMSMASKMLSSVDCNLHKIIIFSK